MPSTLPPDWPDLLQRIKDLYTSGQQEEAIKLYTDNYNYGTTPGKEVLDQLIEVITTWIEESPSPPAFRLRGIAYHQLKQYPNAIEDYDQALVLDPEYAKAYSTRGAAKHKLGKYPEAIEDFDLALALDPEYAPFYYNRGNAKIDLGQFEAAIEDYDKALVLDTESAEAFYNRGNVKSKLGQYAAAIFDFDKALVLDPKFAGAYHNCGNAKYHLGQYKAAIEDYDKTLVLDPEIVLAFYSRGNAKYLLGQYKAAIKDYDEALKLDAKDQLVYYNRASAYEALGNNFIDQSIKDYEKVITLRDQNQYWADRAKEQIRLLREQKDNDALTTINTAIDSILDILRYKGTLITHYTGMDGARILLTDEKSRFRMSEGNFMNDTSEGSRLHQALFQNDNTPPIYTQKPFLGSFVAHPKDHFEESLVIWRMYARTGNNDGCGCAITLDRRTLTDLMASHFIDTTPETKEKEHAKKEELSSSTTADIAFYQVAYLNAKDKCKGSPNNKAIDLQIKKIKAEIKKLSRKNATDKDKANLVIAQERLTEIDYLFKGDEYIYENEVRLVLDKYGRERHIRIDDRATGPNPPKVYMDTVSIIPAIKSITIGPKVARAEEWQTTFTYALAKRPQGPIEITISTLPYK